LALVVIRRSFRLFHSFSQPWLSFFR
jgi:hypothetical protein